MRHTPMLITAACLQWQRCAPGRTAEVQSGWQRWRRGDARSGRALERATTKNRYILKSEMLDERRAGGRMGDEIGTFTRSHGCKKAEVRRQTKFTQCFVLRCARYKVVMSLAVWRNCCPAVNSSRLQRHLGFATPLWSFFGLPREFNWTCGGIG